MVVLLGPGKISTLSSSKNVFGVYLTHNQYRWPIVSALGQPIRQGYIKALFVFYRIIQLKDYISV
jgi:hypothetical protein